MIFAASLLGAGLSFAQNRTISGTVVDAQGTPIPGVAVVVVGNSAIGAVTEMDGTFRLSVPNGANIEVSCIGYASQVLPTANRTTFDIVLEEDAEFLEETVVIGYGVQKKSDLTGADRRRPEGGQHPVSGSFHDRIHGNPEGCRLRSHLRRRGR